jgi:hypothetical protein
VSEGHPSKRAGHDWLYSTIQKKPRHCGTGARSILKERWCNERRLFRVAPRQNDKRRTYGASPAAVMHATYLSPANFFPSVHFLRAAIRLWLRIIVSPA